MSMQGLGATKKIIIYNECSKHMWWTKQPRGSHEDFCMIIWQYKKLEVVIIN
jgi:hypothetical protein